MILTYIGKNSGMLEKYNDYFCFEIYIGSKGEVDYRIVGYDNLISIYYGRDFEVKENSLENMVFIPTNNRSDDHIVRLSKVQELEEKSENVDGVWGAYHDGGNVEIEEEVNRIVIDQARQEGFEIKKITVY